MTGPSWRPTPDLRWFAGPRLCSLLASSIDCGQMRDCDLEHKAPEDVACALAWVQSNEAKTMAETQSGCYSPSRRLRPVGGNLAINLANAAALGYVGRF